MNIGAVGNRGTDHYAATGIDGKNEGKVHGGDFSRQVTQAAGQCPTFVLHAGEEADGKVLGSIAGGGKSNMTVYKPHDFDPEHPVYKVKVWDADGNETERMVDVSKVEASGSDSIDMYAYACYLTDSGQCPEAQDRFSKLHGYPSGHTQGAGFDHFVFQKVDWISQLKNLMQMQYSTGNMNGYLAYKKFADFLSQ